MENHSVEWSPVIFTVNFWPVFASKSEKLSILEVPILSGFLKSVCLLLSAVTAVNHAHNCFKGCFNSTTLF